MKAPATKRGRTSLIYPELRLLVTELAALHKRAKAQGIFANDRELLRCPGCGLKEDVTVNGTLITYREPDMGHDTGLRFKQMNKYAFRCPACGQCVKEPIPDEESDGASLE